MYKRQVNLTLRILPDSLLLPGIFIAACFISLAIGTSVGTIVALVPVAAGIAQQTGLDVALMVAVVAVSYTHLLLWMVTLSTIMLIVLQHNVAHLGIATGLCLSEATTAYLPAKASKAILGSAMLASISTSLEMCIRDRQETHQTKAYETSFYPIRQVRHLYQGPQMARGSHPVSYTHRKLRFAHDSETKTIGVPRLLLSIITFAFVVYMLPGMWGAPLKMCIRDSSKPLSKQ